MARIAFFTESLPPSPDPISAFSYDLMCGLADQQHEVMVFSTYRSGEEVPSHPRVEILRPFRKWSWLELPRLFPLLLQFRPEILHFIQPRAEALSGLTNAMSMVPGLGPVIGRPAVVTSFYDLSPALLPKLRLLLYGSDVATVANRPQLDLLESFMKESTRKPRIAILPIPSAAIRPTETSSEIVIEDENAGLEGLNTFLDSAKKLIFVPGNVSDHRDPEMLFQALTTQLSADEGVAVVLGGEWGQVPQPRRHALMRIFEEKGLGARVFLTGALSNKAERACLEKAHLVFTASLPSESLWLARVVREALNLSSPLMISEKQVELDAIAWEDRQNAFITSPSPETWQSAMSEALRSEEILQRIKRRLPEFARIETVDQPGNVMSRIYASILDLRRAPSVN